MKKIIPVFLLCVFVGMSAFADAQVRFTSDAVEWGINTLVAPERRQAAADEYQKQMDQTTGAISVVGIYKVCASAGMDIRTNEGYSASRHFINTLAEQSGFSDETPDKANCVDKFNGIWSLAADGKTYQCVGKDGFVLAYNKACDNSTLGECIKSFAKLKTQGPIGREFIAEYARKKNLDLTCKIGFEMRRSVTSPLGQDYIQCSAGGKSYEFEFDSLNETPGATSMLSENTALCEFYGGLIVNTDDAITDKVWTLCDVARDICNGELNTLAARIGHSTMYQGYCRISKELKSVVANNLKRIPGVDNYIFYKPGVGGQMRADMAKVQLEEYLRNTFPDESHITCNPTPQLFRDVSMGLDSDYVLTCAVGTKQVDFIFDDLSESFTHDADAGAAGMACTIKTGGRFDGKFCRGLSRAECAEVDIKIPGGTDWDKNAAACVLKDARAAQRINDGITIATGVVVTVGTLGMGAVVAAGTGVVSAGGGLLTLVAVSGAASVGIDAAFIGLNRLQEKAPHHRALQFMKSAKGCDNADCAYFTVKQNFARLGEVFQDLNEDEFNIVADELDRLSELLTDDMFYMAIDTSKLHAGDYALKAGQGVLMMASLFVSPEEAFGRILTRGTRFAAKLSRCAERLGLIGGRVDNLVKTLQKFGKTPKLYYSAVPEVKGYIVSIRDGDNYPGIIAALQKEGWYITDDMRAGERILLVTEKRIDHLLPQRIDWLTRGTGTLTDIGGDLNNALRGFNKQVVLRRGTENSLGKDYYRIRVTNADDVSGIINTLQEKGYYVSSNMTNDGEYFLAVSGENIFGPWLNAPHNWLAGGRSSIFAKVYDDMPDKVLQQKLEYVYNHSQTKEAAVQALKDVGAFDEQKAAALADDLAREIRMRFHPRTDLIDAARKWPSLNRQQRQELVSEAHELITTTRRNHAGNTIVGFDITEPGDYGFHWEHNGRREFGYNLDRETFKDILNTIIHENVHAFQSLGKSSIPKPFVDWSRRNYITPEENFYKYRDNIIEIEARYIGEKTSKEVFRALGI